MFARPAPAPPVFVVKEPEKKKSRRRRFAGWLLDRAEQLAVEGIGPSMRKHPRVTVALYGVVWALLHVPLWMPGWGWGNALWVALNPATAAVVLVVWMDQRRPAKPVVEDRRVAIWNTVIAADHEAST